MILLKICKDNDTKEFKLYLKNGGNINVMDNSWFGVGPILFHLCYIGNYNKMIKYMIKSNVMINVKCNKNSSLTTANWYKDKTIVQLLIKHYANIFNRDYYGKTVIFNKHDMTVEYLYIDLYLQILI